MAAMVDEMRENLTVTTDPSGTTRNFYQLIPSLGDPQILTEFGSPDKLAKWLEDQSDTDVYTSKSVLKLFQISFCSLAENLVFIFIHFANHLETITSM